MGTAMPLCRPLSTTTCFFTPAHSTTKSKKKSKKKKSKRTSDNFLFGKVVNACHAKKKKRKEVNID